VCKKKPADLGKMVDVQAKVKAVKKASPGARKKVGAGELDVRASKSVHIKQI